MTASDIRFGPFFLGYEPARLKCGEEVVKLRPKSLDVLCYLAQRPGQLVGKQELLTRVWTGRVISDVGLRMCIGEIRAALRDDAEAPHYLETVVGQGYRFLQGARIGEPYLLALLSELCLRDGRIDEAGERLAEARARVQETDECWYEAELHRLEGEILLAAAGDGDRGERAEACFRRALEVAGRQGATSLELRAALSLSRLGSSADAHQLLREVLGRFTEGHDTADLRAAQTQLSLIHP